MMVGKRVAKTGIDRIKFDVWDINSDNTPLVLNMTVMEMRKRNHSRVTLVKLVYPDV
jgi:hypothetical protein